jgi:hypothetical protein
LLLSALALGLSAADPALATQEAAIATGNLVAWRGGGANHDWSDPANWQDGSVPRQRDVVRFPAGTAADEALIDPCADYTFHPVEFEAAVGRDT